MEKQSEVNTYLVEENGTLVLKQEVIDKLEELKKIKESAEKELKALSSSIQNELKEKYTMTTKVGTYNFVVKGGYWGLEFDLDLFKEENPETYIKYLKPKFTQVSYQLAKATREKKNV
jgi:hypothetical protein